MAEEKIEKPAVAEKPTEKPEEKEEYDYYVEDESDTDELDMESDEAGSDSVKVEGKESKESSEKVDYKEALEDIAKSFGWKPKKEFKGVQRHASAVQFLKEKTNILQHYKSQAQSQKDQFTELKNSIDQIKAHYEKTYSAEAKKLQSELDKLKSERKTAIEDGDVAKVEKIESTMDSLKEEITNIKQTAVETQKTPPPEFVEWHNENKWYLSDNEMTAYADAQSALPKYNGLPFAKIAEMVTADVKKMFPDKFNGNGSGDKTHKVSSVESAGRGNRRQSTLRLSDLPAELQSAARKFERMGVMTVKQYLEDYAKQEGLK